MIKFIIKNRYSNTNLPDKHGRWARIVYVNDFQIAWISMTFIDNKLFYRVVDYFPSIKSDSPCSTIIVDQSLEQIINDVKLRFNNFILNVIKE